MMVAGKERRRKSDRGLVILNALAALAAIVALIVSLTTISGRIDNLATARIHARYDSCNLLRGVVLVSAGVKRHRQAIRFLALTGLGNCVTYSTHG
jgi:hypothetical protein